MKMSAKKNEEDILKKEIGREDKRSQDINFDKMSGTEIIRWFRDNRRIN